MRDPWYESLLRPLDTQVALHFTMPNGSAGRGGGLRRRAHGGVPPRVGGERRARVEVAHRATWRRRRVLPAARAAAPFRNAGRTAGARRRAPVSQYRGDAPAQES